MWLAANPPDGASAPLVRTLREGLRDMLGSLVLKRIGIVCATAIVRSMPLVVYPLRAVDVFSSVPSSRSQACSAERTKCVPSYFWQCDLRFVQAAKPEEMIMTSHISPDEAYT